MAQFVLLVFVTPCLVILSIVLGVVGAIAHGKWKAAEATADEAAPRSRKVARYRITAIACTWCAVVLFVITLVIAVVAATMLKGVRMV